MTPRSTQSLLPSVLRIALLTLAVCGPLTMSPNRAAVACPLCQDSGLSPLLGAGPNATFIPGDSVAACPGGDTLVAIAYQALPHPSLLRVEIWYSNANCVEKVGVPPDSIWATWSTATGNARVNDKGLKTYADDSTNYCGHTRMTFPSLSGNGSIAITVWISGRSLGTKIVVVRTTDTNADGRQNSADYNGQSDLDYNGVANALDLSMMLAHANHWHRNALHGGMVKRTSFCGTPPCDGSPGVIGQSQVCWSPNGRWLVFTAERPWLGTECKVYVVASDPKDGNVLRQVTFSSPADSGDYDPSWSPLGKEIILALPTFVWLRTAA